MINKILVDKAVDKVRKGEAIILLDDQEAVEKLETFVCIGKAPIKAHYLHYNNNNFEWDKDVKDFNCELIDASEIEYDIYRDIPLF